MKQINGGGSIVMVFAFLFAALFAECIPAMLIFVVIGISGFAWDVLRGNFNISSEGEKRQKKISSVLTQKEQSCVVLPFGTQAKRQNNSVYSHIITKVRDIVKKTICSEKESG